MLVKLKGMASAMEVPGFGGIPGSVFSYIVLLCFGIVIPLGVILVLAIAFRIVGAERLFVERWRLSNESPTSSRDWIEVIDQVDEIGDLTPKGRVKDWVDGH